MRPEPGSSCLANMSAPPRSTVMLPRLSAGAPTEGALSTGSVQHSVTLHEVPVGPGGGRLLSHALCLARVELPTSVCAHLQVGYGAPLLTRPLGLARALVAIARHVGAANAARTEAVQRGWSLTGSATCLKANC